jgi:hypothetical protein
MTRRRAGRATVAAVAALALAAAGCGGDDGPSKKEFVSNANAVCKRHYAKISAAAGKLLAGGALPDPREFGRLAQGTIIPQYTAQVRELRAVKPSKGQAAAYRAWLDDSQALRDRLQAKPALIQNARSLSAVNGQADRLGLSNTCHVGPT